MQTVISWILLWIVMQTANSLRPLPNDISKFEKIRLTDKSFETVRNLHVNWYVHAVRSLMGQLGKQLYQNLPTGDRQRLAHCLDRIDDERDVIAGAECLVRSRAKGKHNRHKYRKWIQSLTKLNSSATSNRVILQVGCSQTLTESRHKKLSSSFVDLYKQTQNNQSVVMQSYDNVSEQPEFTVTSKRVECLPSKKDLSMFAEMTSNVTLPPKRTTSSSNHQIAQSTTVPTTGSVKENMRSKQLAELYLLVNNSAQTSISHNENSNRTFAAYNKDNRPPEAFAERWVGSFRVEGRPYKREGGDTSEKKMHYGSRRSEIEEISQSFDVSEVPLKNITKEIEHPNILRLYLKKQWWSSISKAHLHKIMQKLCHSDLILARKHWGAHSPFLTPSRIRAWRLNMGNGIRANNTEILRSRGKRSPHRLIANQMTKNDKEIIEVQKMSEMPILMESNVQKTPIERVTNLIRTMADGEQPANNWSLSYERLLQFRKELDAKKRLPGAKVYDLRLFDIVLGNEQPSKSPSRNTSFPDFLTMAFGLIDALRGSDRNHTSNIKLLSPRFAPLMPDKVEASKRHLSPSVFAFYKDESPDTIAPVHKILEAFDLSERDRTAVLEMVMDVSGAKNAVEMGLDILGHMNFLGIEGELFEVTKRLDDLFRWLEKSFNRIQSMEINKKGFTFLEVYQIDKLLNGHGVKNAAEVDFDLEKYGRLSKRQREEALWKRLEQIAENKIFVRRRTKRTLPVTVLSPVVLAPYMFSPVVGLSVLGPVVLSPNIFSPLLLNPSVLGPFVLSPAVAMPFILSPYLLSPYVLTPIVMAPFILNPYVLSPNVINPYILSPLILSPYVLCPDVISPQALGGQILSPSVLSPSFLTQSVLMASVLSPTFLS